MSVGFSVSQSTYEAEMFRNGLILCAVLAGCAAPPPNRPPPAPVSVTQPTPVCTSQQQCEAMWINAHEQLQMITGMRLQTATDTVLQTFGPLNAGQLGGMATKYPAGDGKYEIRVRFACRHASSSCEDYKASATNLFNVMVPGPIK